MSTVRFGLYARTAAGGPVAVEAQVQALRAAVALRGGGSVVVERDVNVSGAGGPGPGLAELLRAAAAGRIDVIVVEGLDRLSRSPRTLAGVLASIRRAGASVLIAEVSR